nr:hypothetical protein B0A51_13362 [Rachicladosporium sp. CCFEE 5018]
MPRLSVTQQALRSAVQPATSGYVCLACRAQSQRQFSVSRRSHEEQLPFFKRLTKSIFGDEKSREASKKREDATRKRAEETVATGSVDYEQWVDDKGREWQRAAVVDPSINKDYKQSSDWAGLEMIGGEQWVRDRRDGGEQYIAFNPRRKTELTNAGWSNLLRHVLVEVMVAKQASLDLDLLTADREVDPDHWTRTVGVTFDQTDGKLSMKFVGTGDRDLIVETLGLGVPTIVESEETTEAIEEAREVVEASSDDIIASLENEQPAGEEVVDMAALDAQAKQRMQDIKTVSERTSAGGSLDLPAFKLTDPEVKLTILKRVFQLTSHRLPDAVVSSASTPIDLYHAYITKPAPKKLAQTRELIKVKVSVPNVTVYSRRRTPIDKEKDVGRWKVIEEELLRRNLPVTGSRYQGAKTTTPLA